MNRETRNAIERATQRARKLLEEDFAAQLEGDFDVHRDGAVAAMAGGHLSARQAFQRERIVAAIEHKRAAGMSAANAVRDYLRDAAFTTLNRFVALKMLEARDLVQQCITKGEQSAGFREFCGMAPGIPLLPESAGYRLYIESLFDELSTEVKVLFDRRDPSSVLWPKRTTFEQLLEILNDTELAQVWGEDETIGWVYQFFNGQDERRKMREESQAPRNSRELAVRNQFFTPRYVVQFLTDNTLGRIWYEMRDTKTALADKCKYMVRKPGEEFAPRAKKDPRDLRVLDPACGSGHFLLYAFDLLVAIYEEAQSDPESPKSEATGRTLSEDYPNLDALRKAVPGLVLAHNLHGVDIDPRCAQIAQLALWMRAQKAYRDFGIGRAERAQIRRSNIVVAEPLVADEQIAREFVTRLGDAELGRVFTSLIEALQLAGDLGLLLCIETLVARPSKRGHTGNLFAPPEGRIRSALARFVHEESGRASTRRRLFADDATHGVALLGVAEKKFNVVLMNPPFGLLTSSGQEYLSAHYHGAHNDVYAAFIRRARAICPEGMVGAITSRSFLVTKRLESFRREDIIPSLRYLWDLGLGVMDAASVESAAYVLGPPTSRPILAADGRGRHDRRPDSQGWLDLDRSQIAQLPLAKILYDLPANVHQILSSQLHFEPNIGTAREGMKSFDNERFVRLFWEVDANEIGGAWRRFAKGGRNLRIFARHPLLLGYRSNGRELDEKNRQVNGSTAQVRQASDYWFRPGATYSRRAPEFAPRFLPAEYVFSDKGPAVLSTSPVSPELLLGWLNSRLIRYLVHLQAHKQDYLTGILKKLPWAVPSKETVEDIEEAIRVALRAWLEIEIRCETSLYYCAPGDARGVRAQLAEWKERDEAAARACRDCVSVCDRLVDATYGVDSSSWPQISADDEGDAVDQDEETDALPTDGAIRLLSWAVGAALGRWDANARCIAPEDAFAAPPRKQPGELPVMGRVVMLPDDRGHPNDIVAAVFQVCATRWDRDISSVTAEFEVELGLDGVRRALRESRSSSGLWPYQRETHTAQRRSAPALWRLGTPSGSYSLWLNARGASADTLYQALQSFVDPKVRYEESRLAELRASASESKAAHPSRALAAQQELVGELQEFRQELATVAPMWAPNRWDGFAICAAPLWRLVAFDRAYQRELEASWQALCRGDCDWAQLAMHLWPERVVPKCAKDRSFAIAHGLEDVFWVEGTDGKWTARKTPVRSVDELVRERTSAAGKSALNSLLEAPAAAGKSGGGRGRSRRKGAASAEGGNV